MAVNQDNYSAEDTECMLFDFRDTTHYCYSLSYNLKGIFSSLKTKPELVLQLCLHDLVSPCMEGLLHLVSLYENCKDRMVTAVCKTPACALK